MEHFPFDYCNGFTVFMTTDIIQPMVDAVKRNSFFWIDDVYLYGLLPQTVGDVTFIDYYYKKNHLVLYQWAATNCFKEWHKKCTVIVVTDQIKYSIEKSMTFWQYLTNSSTVKK